MKIIQKRINDRIDFEDTDNPNAGMVATLYDHHDTIVFSTSPFFTAALDLCDDVDYQKEFEHLGLNAQITRDIDCMPTPDSNP